MMGVMLVLVAGAVAWPRSHEATWARGHEAWLAAACAGEAGSARDGRWDPPEEDPPSLDELLGTGEDEGGGEGEAPDPMENELDRRLSGEELGEEFKQAVGLMRETAERLSGSKDTGLATQRLQEDAIRKLDMLISQASRQRREQQRQNRSRENQDSQAPQPTDQQPQPGANPGARENNGMVDPPSRRDGELGALPSAGGAAWGSLPERVREALVQGRVDRFSAMYRAMTEEYYRRLAEDPR